MPFKGDMRLGGPHDNEVGLRGSSEGNGGGFPPYGTFYQTLTGQEYPIAEGGASFYFTEGSYDVPSQICDVDQMHDGAGGYFLDWSTVTNIAYKAVGTLFSQGSQHYSDPVEVPTGSGVYYDSALSHDDFKHDGIGGYSLTVVLESYITGEVDAGLRNYYQTEIPDGSNTFYSNGKYETYNWNGSGGYTLATNQGSYLTGEVDAGSLRYYYEAEVPAGSGAFYQNGKYDTYNWDGIGGYTPANNQGSYYSNGTLITDVPQEAEVPIASGNNYANGKYTRYNWNGSGGYVELTNQGSFYSNGTVIGGGDSEELEVPSNSALYFGTGRYSNYVWDGSGGYTTTFPNGSYYEYGTFITSEGGYNYYWDGNGSYYSEPI